MIRPDLRSLGNGAPAALAFLLLPAVGLAIASGLPPVALFALPGLAAGGPLLLRAWRFDSPDLGLVPPLAALVLGLGVGAPGVAAEVFAVVASVGILAWLAVASHPGRRLRDLAGGLVIPAFGGGVALGLSFLAPSNYSFVGAAATLAGIGVVVAAVIIWLLSRPDDSASLS